MVQLPVGMNGSELFERVRRLWPTAIMGPDHKEALNRIYWPLDERIGADGDDWTGLAAWAFHQALWELVERPSWTGKQVIRPSEVTFDDFDRHMKINLMHETWAAERQIYKGGRP